ncbi:MAG: ATP-binding protein, partial [Thermoproteota archaeon]
MDEFESEWIEQTREIASRLAPNIDKDFVEKLLFVYALENDDKQEVKQEIDSLIDTFSYELFFSKKPILECPSKEEADDEVKIGKIMQGEKILWDFGLSREELNQHVLITGRSGCGKTTLIMQIIQELLRIRIPFLVIDYKIDYRHLVKTYPQLIVINWKDLRINPLEPPPEVSFDEWKQQFLNIFGHIEGIWHGSTQYLLEAIDKAYEEKKRTPKMEDVYKKVVEANETSRKMQEYASVVETRLYGMLSKLGAVINNEKTFIDVEKLLQMPVILELHGLGRDEATLIALWLFYWIYAYRRAKGIRGKLLHVLIIDEAKRIFTASEQYSQTTTEYSGIPPADLICDEIREYSEAIIASDQEPTKLSNSLKANTYTKITGFLGNGKDINDIAEAMDLNEEEREAITKLERGEWLVKLAGRYTKPFLIKTEDFPLKKDVSDEELSKRMQPFLEKLKVKEKTIEAENKEKVFLSEDAWRLLININNHPFLGIAGRTKALGLSPSRVERAKDELLKRNFAVQLEVSLSKRRPTSFLVLTSHGLSFL